MSKKYDLGTLNNEVADFSLGMGTDSATELDNFIVENQINKTTEEKIYTKAIGREVNTQGFRLASTVIEQEKYKEIKVEEKINKEKEEVTYIHKLLKYEVRKIEILVKNEEDMSKTLNEIPSSRLNILVEVIQTGKKKSLNVGEKVVLEFDKFQSYFTKKSEHYCFGCNSGIEQNVVDYLHRLHEMPFTSDNENIIKEEQWVKDVIEFHEFKLCEKCQSLQYAKGKMIPLKKEYGELCVSVKSIARSMEWRMKQILGETNEKIYTCSTHDCSTTIRKDDFLTYKASYPDLFPGLEVYCSKCCQKKIKESTPNYESPNTLNLTEEEVAKLTKKQVKSLKDMQAKKDRFEQFKQDQKNKYKKQK